MKIEFMDMQELIQEISTSILQASKELHNDDVEFPSEDLEAFDQLQIALDDLTKLSWIYSPHMTFEFVKSRRWLTIFRSFGIESENLA